MASAAPLAFAGPHMPSDAVLAHRTARVRAQCEPVLGVVCAYFGSSLSLFCERRRWCRGRSVVTITTVGYGDIVASTHIERL